MEQLDILGCKLSEVINCSVRYPAYGKNIFECNCKRIFPMYVVRAERWEEIKEIHTKEIG